MKIIKLAIDRFGLYESANKVIVDEKMGIIYLFLTTDIGCPPTYYDDWILNDDLGMYVSGNTIYLEKDGDYVYISDLYSENQYPEKVKILRQDLIKLLHDWNEKVCKKRPQEVMVMYKNDKFIIEAN